MLKYKKNGILNMYYSQLNESIKKLKLDLNSEKEINDAKERLEINDEFIAFAAKNKIKNCEKKYYSFEMKLAQNLITANIGVFSYVLSGNLIKTLMAPSSMTALGISIAVTAASYYMMDKYSKQPAHNALVTDAKANIVYNQDSLDYQSEAELKKQLTSHLMNHEIIKKIYNPFVKK